MENEIMSTVETASTNNSGSMIGGFALGLGVTGLVGLGCWALKKIKNRKKKKDENEPVVGEVNDQVKKARKLN